MVWKKWAIAEIKKAGLYEKDSDYGGDLGKALEELVNIFSKQDHSGLSASITIKLFHRLVNHKPLTPITNDPDEWEEVRTKNGEKVYQSKRCPSLFTTKSLLKENKAEDIDYYYKIDEKGRAYKDQNCSKIVNLPYLPSTYSKLKEEK